MAELSVAASLARRLIDFAAERGADARVLAETAGISPRLLDDREARVPLAGYRGLLRAAAAATGDPALPLRYGYQVDMAEFSVVGLLFQACETVAESIVQINRYGRLVVDVDVGSADRFQFVRRQGRLWLTDTRPDPNAFPELTEATFARFIGMTRRFWDTPLVGEVHVTHAAPAHAAEYEKVLEAPALFGREWNAMRIDEARLAEPIARQPRFAFGLLADQAEELLGRLEASRTLGGRIERMLMERLHTGDTAIEGISGRLGMSRQTIYRRLKAEGTTYAQLLDRIRHQLALQYLEGDKVSVAEVAYLLGFSDRVAFSHAFKRWTGGSPRSAARDDGRRRSAGRIV